MEILKYLSFIISIENIKDNKFSLLNEEQNKGYEDEIIKLIELKKLLYGGKNE